VVGGACAHRAARVGRPAGDEAGIAVVDRAASRADRSARRAICRAAVRGLTAAAPAVAARAADREAAQIIAIAVCSVVDSGDSLGSTQPIITTSTQSAQRDNLDSPSRRRTIHEPVPQLQPFVQLLRGPENTRS
jgi:hypothetical protein